MNPTNTNDEQMRAAVGHELKCWPEYFARVLDGSKPYEIRPNDRDFRVGDTLHLLEWQPFDKGGGEYSGRNCCRLVTYITPGGMWGIPTDRCILGLSQPASEPVEPPAAGGVTDAMAGAALSSWLSAHSISASTLDKMRFAIEAALKARGA